MAAPALFTSQALAATELQNQISAAITNIVAPNLPGIGGANNHQVAQAITGKIDANAFNVHNQQSKIVEVHASFMGIRNDGTQAFAVEVMWDADNPPVGSNQTAHYGWEIYVGGQRVAGPRHVFFAVNVILPHYRIATAHQVEDTSLQLNDSSQVGAGTIRSKTQYFKLG